MIYSPQELLQQAIQGPHYAQYPPQNPLALYHRGLAHRVDSASHLPTSQTHIHRQFDTSVESLPPVHVGAPQHTQHISQYNNPHEVMQSQHNEMVHHGGPGNAILAASTPELANNMQQVKNYITRASILVKLLSFMSSLHLLISMLCFSF